MRRRGDPAEVSLGRHGTERKEAVKAMGIFVTGLAFTLMLGTFALISLVSFVAGVGSAATSITITNPSDEALADIPAVLLKLFIAEAQQCEGLPWQVMAGISKIESNHGRFGGATIGADGVSRPSIIGIALNGSNGTARIADSDDGRWDDDTAWDRAVGPFQFIPSSWRIFGGDGNGDGLADPNNVHDAVPAMPRHLCPDGRIVDIEAAVFSYNRSREYVEAVLEWAKTYTGPLTSAALPIAGYALPVSPHLVDEARLSRPHHDYPAWDLGIPVRTSLFAMTAGTISTASSAGIYPDDPNRCGTTVILIGVDGATYTYCHLSELVVRPGQVVAAGTLVGLSGGQPGAPGAGNTTGPHLHLGIRLGGTAVCPQPLILAIARQTPINPVVAPSAGCVQGRPTTDWSAWLDRVGVVPVEEPEEAQP